MSTRSRGNRKILKGGAPAITVTPSSWDFGATPVGTPVSKIFTIQNTGTSALLITLPITSDNAAFTITAQPGSTSLAPGASTTFTAQATATVATGIGAFSGNLSIVNNSATNPKTVAVTATVTNTFEDLFTGTTIDTAKWTETDPDGVISQNNELIFATGGAGGLSTNTLVSVPNFSPVTGDAVVWRHGAIAGAKGVTGFNNNTFAFGDARAELSTAAGSSLWRAVTSAITIQQAWATGDYAAWVLLTGRSFLLHKPSAGSTWRIVFTHPASHPDFGQTNVKLQLGRGDNASGPRWDEIAVTKIVSSNYDADYSGSAVAAGTSIALPADGFVEFLWTPSAGQSIDLMFRRVSDTDTLSLVLDQAQTGTANAMKLVNRNGGDTNLATSTQTITAGTQYRVALRFAGTAIAAWFVAASGTASAANISTTSSRNQAVAAGKLAVGTADAIKAWAYEV